MPKFNYRFARQNRYNLSPEFPLASPYSGTIFRVATGTLSLKPATALPGCTCVQQEPYYRIVLLLLHVSLSAYL